MPWADHLVIAPVVLPLVAGALMLLLDERHRTVRAAINVVSTFVLAAVAVALLRMAEAAPGPAAVYLLGGWPAPFGIVLVLDRLSALMLVLTGVLASAALLFSLARWHRAGVHFHALFQFLLMGLNGTFLTGDLFNLFVFFELLLAASYGLALHGSGPERVRAGLHYIAVNLAASLLFLIGVSLIYAVTGTLNMADLAVRIPAVSAQNRMLLEAGAGVLGIAFLVKAGMWPLCFGLAPTYAAGRAPVAAIFAIMTKVGVYIVLRLWLLLFGAGAGASARFGADWLVYGGMMTLGFGLIGTLAARDLRWLASFAVLVSSGTLLAAIGFGEVAVTGGALFYLVSSTLALAAFFLLIELTERGRADGFLLAQEAIPDEHERTVGVEVGAATPRTVAILGLGFMGCALLLAGLPPFSGFIGKFALLTALLNPAGIGGGGAVPATAWALLVLLLLSGLTTIIAMSRLGVQAFWVPSEQALAQVQMLEIAPVALLLCLTLALTIEAGPAMHYMQATAAAAHAPWDYVRSVLGTGGA
ncbi:MAG: monovalent cation/H+ antiporter subunit D [Acetobacteraceae bacterium]